MSEVVNKINLLLPAVHLHELTFTKGDEEESTLEKYISIKNVAKGNLTDGQKTNLLLQVDHCLLRLHQEDISCSPLSDQCPLFVVKDFDHEAAKKFKRCEDSEKKSNIKLLADLYCHVLTNGKHPKYFKKINQEVLECSDPFAALDIIEKMASEENALTIEEVLQHPFHWDDVRKVNFICKAVDFINSKLTSKSGVENGLGSNPTNKMLNSTTPPKGKETNLVKSKKHIILEYYKMGNFDDVTEKEWVKNLKLSKKEILQINREHNLEVSENLIYNEACNKKGVEPENSVFELARFFRNRYVHFQEDGRNIKACFGSYPSGYLNFFTERFPKFFMHVYNNMEEYLCTNSALGEFAAAPEHFSTPLRNVQFHIKSSIQEQKNSKVPINHTVQEP